MIPLGTPRPSPFRVVEEATRPPYACSLIPGTSGPFIDTNAGYISATSLASLIDAAGWPHPDEVEPLRADLRAARKRIAELEREAEANALDAERVAAAEEMLANASRTRVLVDRLAPAHTEAPAVAGAPV